MRRWTTGRCSTATWPTSCALRACGSSPWWNRRTQRRLFGWRTPGWTGPLLLVGWLSAFVLLVGGPVPERATRWAWFWLIWNPFGVLVFALLSGPFPGVPGPRPGARRLTGGWAFLLSLVLGGGALAGS